MKKLLLTLPVLLAACGPQVPMKACEEWPDDCSGGAFFAFFEDEDGNTVGPFQPGEYPAAPNVVTPVTPMPEQPVVPPFTFEPEGPSAHIEPDMSNPPTRGQNPGNNKPVGNAPFDGERGQVPSGKDKL